MGVLRDIRAVTVKVEVRKVEPELVDVPMGVLRTAEALADVRRPQVLLSKRVDRGDEVARTLRKVVLGAGVHVGVGKRVAPAARALVHPGLLVKGEGAEDAVDTVKAHGSSSDSP